MGAAFHDFDKDVIEASHSAPVVVDFWAEWCAPCRTLSPILEKLAEAAQGRWRLIKINTQQHPDVAAEWNVRSIPAVKLFYQGQVIAEFVGALPEPQVAAWLEMYVPTESSRAVDVAFRLIAEGKPSKARKWLEKALALDERNTQARVALAELLFDTDPARAAQLARGVDPQDALFDQAEALVTLHRLSEVLEKHADKAPDSEAWQQYLEGIRAFQDRRYADALEKWIEAIRRDRKMDDDGARKACVALFERLGNDHEITQKYRRAFSSALY